VSGTSPIAFGLPTASLARLKRICGVKAVIARYGPIPRSHDLVGPLDELRASRRFDPAEDEAMSMLRACAVELGYEQHVRSDYGEEASFRTPGELFGESDAVDAVETARRARSIAQRLLEGSRDR